MVMADQRINAYVCALPQSVCLLKSRLRSMGLVAKSV